MKKRSVLSLLLALSILLSLALPVATTAYAEGEADQKKGMETSKSIDYDEKTGKYTITLEAYATGEKVISQVTKDVPTDIILVLDQSGSMAEDIGQIAYEQYKDERYYGYHTRNQDYYEYRHNGGSENLWYPLSDGSFVSVSVTKTTNYTALGTSLVNYDSNFWGVTTGCYYYYANNLYEKVGTEYKKIELTRTRSGRNYIYTYTFSDGTTLTSNGDNTKPNLGAHSPLYTPAADNNNTVYTYTYTDSNGTVQTIGTSTGATTRFTPAFYQRTVSTSGGGTRLDALKNAATAFVEAVNEKAKGADKVYGGDDDIDHRIAIVGFSSDGYNNTELLTGSTITKGQEYLGTDPSTYYNYYYFPTGYEMNGPQYGNITDAQYKNALQQVKTAAGFDNVKDGINALTAYGGTMTQNGLDMANKIFEQNPLGETEKRNRVVIVFTDGVPGSNGYNPTVANSAIDKANTAKVDYGATVYTIGIFSGANASSEGNQNGNETEKANWFMQNLSSNKDGKPQTPSYYLSAGDSESLNSIFKQISDNIESGGSSVELDEKTVIKDIITPQFTLPAGATVNDITLETYACTGKNGDEYTWSKNDTAMGATATITSTDETHETTTQNQVNVTGFNFKENYVGTVTENGTTTYRGNKLVIKFNVTPRDGFLGGNGVITNGAKSGVYKDKATDDPEFTFEQPKVDVTIKEPTVTVPDANVFLGAYFEDTVSADQLKEGTTIKFGDDIVLDMTQPDNNWGLEPWQTEYVKITVKVTDKDGNEVTDFKNLREDTDYKVSVSIKPETPKEGNNGYDKGMEGTIHVFTPELTYKDSTAYYGESVPANNDFSANLTETKWKHVDGTDVKYSTDKDVTMLGSQTAPELNITYTPDASKLDGTKYGKNDVPVKVGVKIGNEDVTAYTEFVHTDCASDCGWTTLNPANGDPAFLIHIKTCTLNITKAGGNAGEPYVFDVIKDGKKYTQVTVVGNTSETIYELPVGTYTIQEDTGWSWRFTPTIIGNGVELKNGSDSGTITCTNTKTTNQWLNGFSQVIQNIFGVAKH